MLSLLFGPGPLGTAKSLFAAAPGTGSPLAAGLSWPWLLIPLTLVCLSVMVALGARARRRSAARDLEAEEHPAAACRTARRLAFQAAHDIRSPLVGLQWLLEQSSGKPRERQILELAIARLHRVADDLAFRALPNRVGPEFTLLNWALHSALQERQTSRPSEPRWRLVLGPGTESAGVCAPRGDVAAALHSLLDAVAATGPLPIANLSLSLSHDDADFSLAVEAMPEPVLATSIVGNGAPARLPHSAVERLGGVLETLPDGGARLRLPLSPPPPWLLSRFRPAPNRRQVILDDDPGIHRLWKEKLPDYERAHLTSALEFSVEDYPPGGCEYWLDHDLAGNELSGLDLIQIYHLGSQAVLVTSRFEDPELQARVARLGARLLPKFLLPLLPTAERDAGTRSSTYPGN